jgi:hypothetical protein
MYGALMCRIYACFGGIFGKKLIEDEKTLLVDCMYLCMYPMFP